VKPKNAKTTVSAFNFFLFLHCLKGGIFITAGQRPAEYTAIYFCLKGRILMFCSCLSGSVVGDIPVRRSATRGYENPSFQDNEPANDNL
jgi:hypothetical protein